MEKPKKTVSVELDDELADDLSTLVQSGLFDSEEDAICAALSAFIENLSLTEQFQGDDISWAVEQKNRIREDSAE